MERSLFTQNVIAIIWDFDKTLTPSYMQAPLFRRYAVDESKFWTESNGLAKVYRERGAQNVSRDSLYLNHILTYVRSGIFKDLSNKILLELGAEIEFYEGMPDCLARLKDAVQNHGPFRKHDISVEHYIVSTGLRQMIAGSSIAPRVDGIWGCEFVEGSVEPHYLDEPQKKLFPISGSGPITDIAYAIDNTTKTRAIFEINKGANKHPEIDVNATLAREDRRVPFQNMIYVADGPSDVPSFSIVNQYGGRTFAVYKPRDANQFAQVNRLQRDNRVQGIGEAFYIEGSLTSLGLSNAVEDIANRIVESRATTLRDKVGLAPRHIVAEPPGPLQKPSGTEDGTTPAKPTQIPERKLPSSVGTETPLPGVANL